MKAKLNALLQRLYDEEERLMQLDSSHNYCLVITRCHIADVQSMLKDI